MVRLDTTASGCDSVNARKPATLSTISASAGLPVSPRIVTAVARKMPVSFDFDPLKITISTPPMIVLFSETLFVSAPTAAASVVAAVARVLYGNAGVAQLESTNICVGATATRVGTVYQSVQVVPPSGEAETRTVK